ncbi:P-type conjugative transfer protein TrbL [Methylotuvimicrobium sp.]|uniref:P-type conjugative transfer protein TrbL n=1 Tax=Methylotuvimicrobium sp. TaxID=2822413 RepID=UPI003D65F875
MRTMIKPAVVVAAFVLLKSTDAAAQLAFHDSGTNQGILDKVITEFSTRASGWRTFVMNAALWLFWTLGTISLVWTGGMMILRKADIGEFFAEFFRFIMFFGFFLWLLRNGPEYADSIIKSLRQIGENAIGKTGISPSGIVNVGFMIFKQAIKNMSAWQPIDSLVGLTLSAGILLLLAAVAVNMLLILVSAWILMYAGIFFLGFGGSRWTSDMAINYYKTVLGVAVQLFAMVLLVGIGNDLLSTFYDNMNKGTLNFEELGVMLVFCFALMMLVNRIPPLLSGIITGASIGGAGIGQFGSGAAIGAAGMATAAAATGGAMVAAGAANAAGGAQAVMAAFSKASENVSSGSDVLTNMWGSSAAGGESSDSSNTGGTPFAKAAGFSNSSDSMWGRGDDMDAKWQAESGTEQAKSDGKQTSGSTESTSSAKTGQGGNRQSTGTQSGGFMAAAATSGKIAVDAGVNLAKGIVDVTKAKANERIADTTPGKIAGAIRGGSSSETNIEFAGNSLSGETDAHSEVAAFVNRDNSGAPT